jgi:hypothetical protein
LYLPFDFTTSSWPAKFEIFTFWPTLKKNLPTADTEQQHHVAIKTGGSITDDYICIDVLDSS